MSSPTKSLKEKTKEAINLEPYKAIRDNLLLDEVLDVLNLTITNETTIFNYIRT